MGDIVKIAGVDIQKNGECRQEINLIEKAMGNKGICILGTNSDCLVSKPIIKIYDKNSYDEFVKDFAPIKINSNISKYLYWSKQRLLVLNNSFESMAEEVEC